MGDGDVMKQLRLSVVCRQVRPASGYSTWVIVTSQYMGWGNVCTCAAQAAASHSTESSLAGLHTAHLWVVIKSHAHAHRALSVIAQKILNVDERSMVGEPVSVCLELCVAGISAVPNMGLVMRRC